MAKQPEIKRLWKMMMMFQLPINDERIQSMTEEQMELMEWSSIVADPEKLKKLENYFYDPDYDKELEDTDIEDSSSIKFNNNLLKITNVNINNNKVVEQPKNNENSVEEEFDEEWNQL